LEVSKEIRFRPAVSFDRLESHYFYDGSSAL
jgi:hypothetical protein